MRKRSKSREYALQMLYEADIRHANAQEVQGAFWQIQEPEEKLRVFANKLVEGTMARLGEIDSLITAHADNWNLERMAVIDRNILRLGVFELMFCDDVPPKVCLNEAVELAKRFGDAESGRFVNGVLDAIHRAVDKNGTLTQPAN